MYNILGSILSTVQKKTKVNLNKWKYSFKLKDTGVDPFTCILYLSYFDKDSLIVWAGISNDPVVGQALGFVDPM
jgi:hypothetical protein